MIGMKTMTKDEVLIVIYITTLIKNTNFFQNCNTSEYAGRRFAKNRVFFCQLIVSFKLPVVRPAEKIKYARMPFYVNGLKETSDYVKLIKV